MGHHLPLPGPRLPLPGHQVPTGAQYVRLHLHAAGHDAGPLSGRLSPPTQPPAAQPVSLPAHRCPLATGGPPQPSSSLHLLLAGGDPGLGGAGLLGRLPLPLGATGLHHLDHPRHLRPACGRAHSLLQPHLPRDLAKVRTVKMTFVIVLAYIACWAPFFSVQMWAVWDENAPDEDSTNVAFTISMLLGNLSSCCNPWIYMAFNNHLLPHPLRNLACCRGPPPQMRRQLSNGSLSSRGTILLTRSSCAPTHNLSLSLSVRSGSEESERLSAGGRGRCTVSGTF